VGSLIGGAFASGGAGGNAGACMMSKGMMYCKGMQAVQDCPRHPIALICELVQGFTGAAALDCFEQCEY